MRTKIERELFIAMTKETLYRLTEAELKKLIEQTLKEWEPSPSKKFREGYGVYWEPVPEYVAMLNRAKKYYEMDELLHPAFIIGAWHGEHLKHASRSSLENYGEINDIIIDKKFLEEYEKGKDLGISLGAEKYADR